MKERYIEQAWDDYANAHLTVLTSAQLEIYRDVATMAHGMVIDLGCGTARTTPFLTDNARVTSYTGIDASQEMVNAGRWLINQLDCRDFRIIHSKIEDLPIVHYDFAFSIHSYYSWPEPLVSLQRIFDIVAPGGEFVLVTPNKKMDMKALAIEADKELLTHPNYPVFRSQNLALAGNEKALFVDMNTLVQQTTEVGFKVLGCHQHYYNGGVNWLHLAKTL